MNFDPSKHKIVAVVTEKGPEQGQHFHLSLPDLAQVVHETTVIKEVQQDDGAIKELRRQIAEIRDRPQTVIEAADTTELDAATAEIATLKGMFSQLVDEVAALKAREPAREVVKVEATQVEKLPQQYVDRLEAIARDLARFKDSQEFVLPRAFQEITERVEKLETVPVDITPADPNAITITPEMLDDIREGIADSISANAAAMSAMATLTRYVDSSRQRISILEDELMALRQHFEPRRRPA